MRAGDRVLKSLRRHRLAVCATLAGAGIIMTAVPLGLVLVDAATPAWQGSLLSADQWSRVTLAAVCGSALSWAALIAAYTTDLISMRRIRREMDERRG